MLNGKGGINGQSVITTEEVIEYIENYLDGKLEVETVAEAVITCTGYSPNCRNDHS